MEIQETQTVVETPVETKPEVQLSKEEQLESLKKISTMKHKAFSELVRVHLADLLNDLAFKPGVSGAQKVAQINTILATFEGVLDLGLDITKRKVPEKGAYARRTVQLGGILAQALDNRMLLLASRLEDTENNVTEETKTEETQDGIA